MSSHRDRFAVRGSWSFAVWLGDLPRRTRALDMVDLGGDGDPVATFREATSGRNGSVLGWERMTITRHGSGQGDIVSLLTTALVLSKATPFRIMLALDPRGSSHVERIRFSREKPDGPLPLVSCMSREWLIAEKVALLVTYGISHSRPRDLYDIWVLTHLYAFRAINLVEAFRTCFAGREAEILITRDDEDWASGIKVHALTPERRDAWASMAADSWIPTPLPSLGAVLVVLEEFLLPLLRYLRGEAKVPYLWRPGVGWVLQAPLRSHTPSRRSQLQPSAADSNADGDRRLC
ncbi:nucleotidyl transferase AbiEii/AbiGii toxin family protein [Muricoccus vinaceus]|uniref:Nucleotidyl transferase AbiEii/AbiGii toxin family protein n=1 Tax=Muricoccus vinaceus TaxID=424704 RepID=A0ABV6IT64_9PROT